ncbi:MAG TPA: hypothetical protein PKV80_21765 [Leptospiraceae bacterium]|nr:hypothetical protein [Leptospiraceae bacterium]
MALNENDEPEYDIELSLDGFSGEESLQSILSWPEQLQKDRPIRVLLFLGGMLDQQWSGQNISRMKIVNAIGDFFAEHREQMRIVWISLSETEIGDNACAELLKRILEPGTPELLRLDFSCFGGITMAQHYKFGFGPQCRSALLNILRKKLCPNLEQLSLNGCRLGRTYGQFEGKGFVPDYLPGESDFIPDFLTMLPISLPRLSYLNMEYCSLSEEEKTLTASFRTEHLKILL